MTQGETGLCMGSITFSYHHYQFLHVRMLYFPMSGPRLLIVIQWNVWQPNHSYSMIVQHIYLLDDFVHHDDMIRSHATVGNRFISFILCHKRDCMHFTATLGETWFYMLICKSLFFSLSQQINLNKSVHLENWPKNFHWEKIWREIFFGNFFLICWQCLQSAICRLSTVEWHGGEVQQYIEATAGDEICHKISLKYLHLAPIDLNIYLNL